MGCLSKAAAASALTVSLLGSIPAVSHGSSTPSHQDIVEANQVIFKRLKIIDRAAIRCYRAGSMGDESAAKGAYILAKNAEVTQRVYKDAAERGLESSMDFASYFYSLESNPLIQEYQAFVQRYGMAKRYCMKLLASDPEEAKKIEKIIENLEEQ